MLSDFSLKKSKLVFLPFCKVILHKNFTAFLFTASLQDKMANPKEKTPMCLVNELARFNRVQPQYKLLKERGPAHSKVRFRREVVSHAYQNL